MSQSFYKIILHVVFNTKHKQPLISNDLRPLLINYIKDQLTSLGCVPISINAVEDHIHLLFLQNPKGAIADTLKQLKGSSSFWINKNEFINENFSWHRGYGVFSISEEHIPRVSKYIKNQEEHHKFTNFDAEMNNFVEHHNLKID